MGGKLRKGGAWAQARTSRPPYLIEVPFIINDIAVVAVEEAMEEAHIESMSFLTKGFSSAS